MRVCPYNKLTNSLPHRAMKAAIARLPMLNPFFAWADDLSGYGKALDPAAWWEQELGPCGWKRGGAW